MVTMHLEREVRLLSLVDVLEPLSEEELEEVATRCRDIRLDVDEEIFGSEEYDGGLFLLEEGHLVIYKLTSSGTQLTIALHSAGAVLPALRLRGLYAKALEPSVVAFMSREDLEDFLRRNPQMAARLLDLLAEQLCLMDTRLSDVIHKDVRSRLASFLLWLISEEGVVVGGGDYVVPYRLHPRAVGDHRRSQTGSRNPCFRVSAGRGDLATEKAAHPRYELEAPSTHRRARALVFSG